MPPPPIFEEDRVYCFAPVWPSVVYNIVRSITKVWLDPAYSNLIQTLIIESRCSLSSWGWGGQSDKGQGHSDCGKAALGGHVLVYKQTLVNFGLFCRKTV